MIVFKFRNHWFVLALNRLILLTQKNVKVYVLLLQFMLPTGKKSPRTIFGTVKLDFKELLIKEQIDFKELFTDYQLFYTINLLLNKELLLI